MENSRAGGRNVVGRELSLGDRVAVEEVTAVPRDRDFKKLVRQRMHKTGESFTAARAQLLALPGGRRLASHPGGTGMYPFDRFTEPAKDVLVLAQQGAEASGTGYIGTEHLLLGLLTSGGAAAVALQRGGAAAGAGGDKVSPRPRGTVHGRPRPASQARQEGDRARLR